MIEVEGIILILSCQRHKNNRLKEFKLHKSMYDEWKVIYVIGDLFQKENFKLNGDILYVKKRRIRTSTY
jgi:hypothetical protein